MKRFRINTIVAGLIFLAVFSCGEAPLDAFSFSAFPVEAVVVVDGVEVTDVSLDKFCQCRVVLTPVRFCCACFRNFSFPVSLYRLFSSRAVPPRASPFPC
ncbi:hypothetical protein [Desulfurobacterium sp.]